MELTHPVSTHRMSDGIDERVATRVVHALPDAITFPERFVISQWYVIPLVERLVPWLAKGWMRPNHLTLLNLLLALCAVTVVCVTPWLSPCAAALVWVAWLCDRCDGPLARVQGTASRFGAWLDANVDELIDVALHAGLAWSAMSIDGSWLPGAMLVGFLGGKYLCVFGLMSESADATPKETLTPVGESRYGWWRRFYHLAGDADVRLHVMLCSLLGGWFTVALAYGALYYNARWMLRYVLMARRAGVWG